MALYKIVPKNPYYFWSVMSLIMQVCTVLQMSLTFAAGIGQIQKQFWVKILDIILSRMCIWTVSVWCWENDWAFVK